MFAHGIFQRYIRRKMIGRSKLGSVPCRMRSSWIVHYAVGIVPADTSSSTGCLRISLLCMGCGYEDDGYEDCADEASANEASGRATKKMKMKKIGGGFPFSLGLKSK